MKFCGNCGTQLNDDAVFCANCGAKIAAEVPVQQPVRAPKKPMNKKMIGLIIGIIVAVIAAAVVVVMVMNRKKTINVNDYITVQYEGYNSTGTARATLDMEEFVHAITEARGEHYKSKKEGFTIWGDKELQAVMDLLSIDSAIHTEFDRSEGLSNGDEITLTITMDEEEVSDLGVKLVAHDQSYTVEGLSEIEETDPFENLTVTYKGAAPNVTVELRNEATQMPLSYIEYSIKDPKPGYDIGDTFTVEISDYSVENALENGYRFTQTEKTYTIDTADRYVTKLSDLSEAALQQMKITAETVITDYESEYDEDVTVSEQKNYVGCYLLVAKEQSEYSSQNNILYLVYSSTISSKENRFAETKVYYPVEMKNVLIKTDGSIDFASSHFIQGYSAALLEDGTPSGMNLYGQTDGSVMYEEIIKTNLAEFNYEMSESLQEFGN